MQTLNPATPEYLNSLFTISSESNEWKYLENELSKIELNKGINQPLVARNYGEVWQYLYSEEARFTVFGKKSFNHIFRHRNHPKTHKLEYIEMPASDSFCVTKSQS
ncbi:hypothetical protein ACMAZF_20325 (plasmid) [Psychrobium sp. nBUS_13]|uniref:hypothetical protein n=1 Tax=Psychrobium sp. nBUS_13 TaxID=3395319 RepID=UPI003EBD6B2C